MTGMIYVLLAICLVQCVFLAWQFWYLSPTETGSRSPLRLYGNTMYDTFYAEMRPHLLGPFPGTAAAVQMCTPKSHSCCLVVGEGEDGVPVAKVVSNVFLETMTNLKNMTFVFCADARSKPQGTDSSKNSSKHISVTTKSPLHPNCFPAQSFTHILCTGLSLYRYDAPDRRRLLRNLHRWIKPGGTLVLQTASAEAIQSYVRREGTTTDGVTYSADAHIHQTKKGANCAFLVVEESFSGNLPEGRRRTHEYILFHDLTADIVRAAQNEGFVTRHSAAVAPGVNVTSMVG